MLAPMTHEPSSQSRAQPTWKFEYGPRFGRTYINMTSEKAAVKLNHGSSNSTKTPTVCDVFSCNGPLCKFCDFNAGQSVDKIAHDCGVNVQSDFIGS